MRADLKWRFEVYTGNSQLEKYGFLLDHVNDLSMSLFSQLKDEAEASQMIEVIFSGKFFFTSIAKVLKKNYIISKN